MQSSHMPLSTWFWGAYLMTTQTPGQSAVQFQRQLDIAAYETAFHDASQTSALEWFARTAILSECHIPSR
jgi:hypothetical protein